MPGTGMDQRSPEATSAVAGVMKMVDGEVEGTRQRGS